MAYSKIKKDGTPALPTKHKTDHRRGYKVSLEDFIRKTNEYIQTCEKTKQIPLMTELAWILGIDTDTLGKYRQNPKYGRIIKRMDQMTENGLIRKGINENKPVFPMFMLKAKYGYVEAQYQKLDVTVKGLGNVVMPSKKPRISS